MGGRQVEKGVMDIINKKIELSDGRVIEIETGKLAKIIQRYVLPLLLLTLADRICVLSQWFYTKLKSIIIFHLF